MSIVIEKGARIYKYDPVANIVLCLEDGAETKTEPLADNSIASSGVQVFIELTKKCNLTCSYCYLDSMRSSKKNELIAKEKYERITATLDQLISRHDSMRVVFYGGEPLLEYPLMKRLCDYCDEKIMSASKEIVYDLVTNGVLVDDEVLDFIINKRISVSMSLDGGKDTMLRNRGMQNIVMLERVIRTLWEEGLPVAVMATIHKLSIASITADIDYLLSLPVATVQFTPCESVCSKKYISTQDALTFCEVLRNKVMSLLDTADYDDLKKLRDVVHAMHTIAIQRNTRSHCGFGQDVIGIAEDGQIYPCPSFIGVPGFSLSDPNIKVPRAPHKTNCTACVARHTCGGGCKYSHYIAVQSNEDYMEARCKVRREFTRLAFKLYVDLYLD